MFLWNAYRLMCSVTLDAVYISRMDGWVRFLWNAYRLICSVSLGSVNFSRMYG